MELKFSGQFNKDIDINNRYVLEAVRDAIREIKKAKDISQIQNLIKLKKHKAHYRIKVSDDYRIGIIIRGNTIWFARFGHRNNFYKSFP